MGVNYEATLAKATGEPKRKKGESFQDFARRQCDALNNMEDAEGDAAYDSLPQVMRDWYDASTRAIDKNRKIPPLPGAADEDAEDEPHAADDEDEQAEDHEDEAEDADPDEPGEEDEGEGDEGDEGDEPGDDDEPGDGEDEGEGDEDDEPGYGAADGDEDQGTEPEEEVRTQRRTAPQRAAPQRAAPQRASSKQTDRRPVKRTAAKTAAPAERKTASAPARRENSSSKMDNTDLLCSLVIKNPKASVDELVEKVRAKGGKASDNLASQVKNIGAKLFKQLNANGYKAPKV